MLRVASLLLIATGLGSLLIPGGPARDFSAAGHTGSFIDPASGKAVSLYSVFIIKRVRFLGTTVGISATVALTPLPQQPDYPVSGTRDGAVNAARRTMAMRAGAWGELRGEALFDDAMASPTGTVVIIDQWRYPVAFLRFIGPHIVGAGLLGLLTHYLVDDRRKPPVGVCPGCGYSRTGLDASAVCPECGAEGL